MPGIANDNDRERETPFRSSAGQDGMKTLSPMFAIPLLRFSVFFSVILSDEKTTGTSNMKNTQKRNFSTGGNVL